MAVSVTHHQALQIIELSEHFLLMAAVVSSGKIHAKLFCTG